ncbi:IclR family transcriptional regulator [bacterium]|nr:MAG: IclR family transcriptional regulator [bacterium]
MRGASVKTEGRAIQAIERTSRILLSFVEGEPLLGVSEIARKLALPKSVVHRALDALVETGLVARDRETSRYRLGPRALELGLAAVGAPDVRTLALPIMQELVRESGETATLSLLVGVERVYVAQVESPQEVRMTVEVGRRYPIYAGASGRAILAYFSQEEVGRYLDRTALDALTPSTITDRKRLERELAKVRAHGYAASSGERDPWAAAVAAPILPSGRRVIGSMSICGPRTRLSTERVAMYGEVVRHGADELANQLW